MNSAIHQMALSRVHEESLRPHLPDEPKPYRRPWRRSVALLRRLRPVLV
jgi:hypothetical protein